MKARIWKTAVVGVALTACLAGAGALWAAGRKSPTRRGLLRPMQKLRAQSPQEKAKKIQAAAVQQGLLMVLEFDESLSRDLDLDDNGDFLDNGDRALRQGDIWLSNRNGALIRPIGKFATEFTYLDVSGEGTGTDISQVTDLFFFNDGQARASGFWNVGAGNQDTPTLHVDGTTGVIGLRRFQNGQFFFLDGIDDTRELWFLAK